MYPGKTSMVMVVELFDKNSNRNYIFLLSTQLEMNSTYERGSTF